MQDLRVGTHIAALMERRGVTQRQLADMIGVTEVRISRIVNNMRPVTLDETVTIMKALHVTNEEWLSFVED